jgi:hypothetical protein
MSGWIVRAGYFLGVPMCSIALFSSTVTVVKDLPLRDRPRVTHDGDEFRPMTTVGIFRVFYASL